MDYVLFGGKLLDRIDSRLSLGDYLGLCLRRNGDSISLIDGITGATMTHKEVYEVSSRLATSLQKLGIQPNDRISVCCENRFEYILVILASMFLGAPVVPLNPLYTPGELLHCANISKPCIFFCSKVSLEKVCEMAKCVTFIKEIFCFEPVSYSGWSVKPFTLLVQPSNETFRAPKLDPRVHTAVILSSSGTTGLPKGVKLSQESLKLFLSTMKIKEFSFIKPGQRVMSIIPFFHGYGLSLPLVSVSNCASLVVLPRFEENSFLSSIQKYKVEALPVAPPLLIFLAKHPLVDEFDLSSIKSIVTGGAPASSDILKQVAEKFNLQGIHQGYGMTETTIIATYCHRKLKNYNSVGKVLPELMCKIVHPESGKSLPKNQPGEICFKGEWLMQEYCCNEKATKEAIDSEGWLHTGDIGYYDESHLLYVIDRMKELIKYKGYQVAPAEIEALILPYPGVIDVAVIGIPHTIDGEHPAAFIVKHPAFDIDASEIHELVNTKLSPQKRIRGGVYFVESIPKNSNGKIMRKVLRDKHSQKAKL